MTFSVEITSGVVDRTLFLGDVRVGVSIVDIVRFRGLPGRLGMSVRMGGGGQ